MALWPIEKDKSFRKTKSFLKWKWHKSFNLNCRSTENIPYIFFPQILNCFVMMKSRKLYYTLKRSWLGERGNVCFWKIRFPVKVYNELFGCSHCTSPAITREIHSDEINISTKHNNQLANSLPKKHGYKLIIKHKANYQLAVHCSFFNE